MGTAKTYDKVSWHFPEGKGCPSPNAAKRHLVVVMQWLKDNSLLSEEGLEAWDSGIDSDFALTSHMLTPVGNVVLAQGYRDWMEKVAYSEEPSMRILDAILRERTAER